MKCIRSHSTDPFFNLATEEFLLRTYDENFFLIYLNEPVVVIGKHQNAHAEVDHDFLKRKGILLARRISGGGAVYHDPGNINFAFITNEVAGDLIKFKTYTAPIIAALSKFGISAEMGSRNEILAGERKISGTASHVYKNRVLHHGTLLFDADLETLSRALYVDSGHYEDKAVKSVRSAVANVKSLAQEDITIEQLIAQILESLKAIYPHAVMHELEEHEQKEIEGMIRKKFSEWEWNYGYSPKYVVEKEVEFQGYTVKSRTEVARGLIQSIMITGSEVLKAACEGLPGKTHDRDKISAYLQKDNMSEIIIELLF